MPLQSLASRHLSIVLALLAPYTVAAQAIAPPAVYSVGAAFDSARNRVVVFGGFGSGGYVGDTWEWNGSAWSNAGSAGPSARNSPALVYDSKRDRVLMFGGDARPTGDLGDMWERVGGTWRQLNIATPPARTTHVMAYDSRRDRVVLFGGMANNEALGDTWEFDGTAWTRVAATGPVARGLYAMAYDAGRGVTVLFGGTSALRPDAASLGDTWEWDGKAWKKIDITGPSPRDHTQMIYDSKSRAIVLHGGGDIGGAASETWMYVGRAWTRAAFRGPSRRYAKMMYDTLHGTVLLYGGFAEQPSNELWRLDPNGWSRVVP